MGMLAKRWPLNNVIKLLCSIVHQTRQICSSTRSNFMLDATTDHSQLISIVGETFIVYFLISL